MRCPIHRHCMKGLCQADAAIVTLGDRIDGETIHAATRLKILANYAVGYNNINLAAARQRGLIVTNTPDVLTDATADLTWALLLATARRVVEGDALIRSGRWTGWSPTQLLGAEVSGKTLGIIGMGRIGQAVAHRARGVSHAGALSHTPTPRRLITLPRVGAPIVAGSPCGSRCRDDPCSSHVKHPASDRRARIGLDAPHRLRSSIPLVASIIEEWALADALKLGIIAGAGLDVYEREPAIHSAHGSARSRWCCSPIWALPHCSARSSDGIGLFGKYSSRLRRTSRPKPRSLAGC